MPSVECTLKDLSTMVGKKLTVDQVDELVQYAKAELDEYDKDTDILYISCCDTAMPYLWSVEGLARIFRGALGLEKGIPRLKVKGSKNEIIVDKQMAKTRPYISAFSAVGKKMSDELLRQLIQLQEKLGNTYGRKRRKVSIGIYKKEPLVFPLTYTLTKPDENPFVPLEFSKKLTPSKVLEQHPTAKKFAFTLDGLKKYPILLDANKKVLSLIPLINSNDVGKVEVGDTDFFIEVTGSDEEAVDVTNNILAFAFQDRGFTVESIKIKYSEKEVDSPFLLDETIEVSEKQVEEVTGLKLTNKQMQELLEKARYDVVKGIIHIPPYRSDILHPVDVIEDIAVMYGYDNLPISPLTSYTVGNKDPQTELIDITRQMLVGFGFQEVLSPVLTNPELICDKMNVGKDNLIEISEFMSASYSVLRSWITPILMDVLSKNKHHVYPQLIFEQGEVVTRNKDEVHEYHRIAALMCGADMDYTKIRQILDAMLTSLRIEYEVEEAEHDSFIQGRVARIKVKGKGIAYIGEIHPQVLENFDIQLPVAAMELNLTDLYKLTK